MSVRVVPNKVVTVGPQMKFRAARRDKKGFEVVIGRPVWFNEWIKAFVYKFHVRWCVCEKTTGYAFGWGDTMSAAIKAGYKSLVFAGKPGVLKGIREAPKLGVKEV